MNIIFLLLEQLSKAMKMIFILRGLFLLFLVIE